MSILVNLVIQRCQLATANEFLDPFKGQMKLNLNHYVFAMDTFGRMRKKFISYNVV